MRESADALSGIVERAVPVLRAIEERDASLLRIAGGWSAKQILGHLIDSAVNNHQRLVRAALEGDLVWPSYDQNGCVRIESFQDADWGLLIETWSAMNRLLAHILAHLPPEAAQARCRIAREGDMVLPDLARAYLSHLEHHLSQIGA